MERSVGWYYLGIWKHKSNVVFKGGVVDVSQICMLAQLKAWSWARFRYKRI